MKLTKRLQTIVNFVDNCETVADVGTDHGKTLLYLLKTGVAKNAIASDISEKSLNKAKKLLLENGFNNFETCVSNGIINYTQNQLNLVDTIIISGMGGEEIILILKQINSLKHELINLKSVIIQPQNNVIKLRQFASENHFKIVKDLMIKDNEKFYNVIKLVLTKKRNNKINKLEIEFGQNVKFYNADFVNFINYEIEKKQEILNNQINQSVKRAIKTSLKTLEKLNSKQKKLLK